MYYSKLQFNLILALLLLVAPARADICIDDLHVQGDAAAASTATTELPPLNEITNFDGVTSQEILNEYVRQSDELLKKGLESLRALDPVAFGEKQNVKEQVLTLREATKPVTVKHAGQKFKAKYLELRINSSLIPIAAHSRIATYLRRLARIHTQMRIYLSPIPNKSGGTYGFFQPDIKTELALYLDESSLAHFVADKPFDGTVKHEARHLAFEDARRSGREPTEYDYGLEAANGKKASYLEGYYDYMSFEELYAWFDDLMSAILELRDPNSTRPIEEILDSERALVIDRKENGILEFKKLLESTDVHDVSVRIVKKEGVEMKIGDYTLTNTHPKVMDKFKGTAHTLEGKRKVMDYFLNDVIQIESAMLAAREDLPKVRELFEELKAFTGSPDEIREYAVFLEQAASKMKEHFDFRQPAKP